MKYLCLIPFFATILSASMSERMFDLYQKELYFQGCSLGFKEFQNNRHDEPFVSLYAFSCLKNDQIDSLALPLSVLNQSAEARTNAAYFSLLILQKKLLLQALYDNKPIVNLTLPSSSHLLSKIFDLYLKNPQNGVFIKEYKDPITPRLIYKLYTTQSNHHKTIAIDEYYDKILTHHHVYE